MLDLSPVKDRPHRQGARLWTIYERERSRDVLSAIDKLQQRSRLAPKYHLLRKPHHSISSMASPHPTTKAESLDQAISHTSSSKLTVTERYNELLAEQASQPDKVFIDGYELREHDPNLIVLNHDDQEHPRVCFLCIAQRRKQANNN